MSYISRLTNGTPVNLSGVDASSNNGYTNDPRFNFEVPCNATNLRIELIDDSGKSFFNDEGWLMVQRGQSPDSNDDLSTPAIIWTDGLMSESQGGYQPVANLELEGTYVLNVPGDQLAAGEWYVALDFSTSMQGGSLTVSWDHGGPTPLVRSNIIAGFNGAIADGDDFFFTLPVSNVYVTWSIEVPSGYTLTGVLNDNADGDLAANIVAGGPPCALILTLSEDAVNSAPTNVETPAIIGVAFQNVPFAASYTNTTSEPVTVYVSAANLGPSTMSDLRLIINCVLGTKVLNNSDHPEEAGDTGSDGWYLNYTALTGTGVDTSPGSPTSEFLSAFTGSESPYAPAYLSVFPTQDTATVSSQGYHSYARFTQTNNANAIFNYQSEDGTQGGVGCVFGYNPTYYKAATYNNTSGINNYLLSPINTDTFSQPASPAVVMAYELVTVTWTRSGNTGMPTWNSMRREVRFVMTDVYRSGLYSSGELSRIDLLGLNLTAVNSSAPQHIASLDDLYSNSGQDTEVAEFGFDTLYTLGDSVTNGSDAQALENGLAAMIGHTTLTTAGNGNDVVHTDAAWVHGLPVIFTDSTQGDGQLVDGQVYFLGIVYTAFR